jgi:hypothetical protein
MKFSGVLLLLPVVANAYPQGALSVANRDDPISDVAELNDSNDHMLTKRDANCIPNAAN